MRDGLDPELAAWIEEADILIKRKVTDPRCLYCKVPITMHNLASMFPDEGYPKFTCDSPFCTARDFAKTGGRVFWAPPRWTLRRPASPHPRVSSLASLRFLRVRGRGRARRRRRRRRRS